jgi:hypothetical protein
MQTVQSSGGVLTLAHGARVTVQGEALIVNGYGAYMDGWGEDFPLDQPVPLAYEPFAGFSGTSPTWGTAVTVQAQVKSEKVDRQRNPADGPGMPETRKVLYLQEADTTRTWPIVRVELQDQARGLMFPGLYVVKLVPYTVAAQTATQKTLRLPASPSPVTPGTARTLHPIFVSLTDQVDFSSGLEVRKGDALIRIPRDEATEAELLGDSWIEITPLGANPIRYRPTGPQGVVPDQTFHWSIYLERMPERAAP